MKTVKYAIIAQKRLRSLESVLNQAKTKFSGIVVQNSGVPG